MLGILGVPEKCSICYLLADKEVEMSRGGTQPITIQQLVEFSGTHRSKDAITKARSTPEYLEILSSAPAL